MTSRTDDDSEASEFAKEMADVIPLPDDPRGKSHPKAPTTAPRAEAPALRSEDLDGANEDFAVSGVSRDELRKLKRGDYPAQDQKDLHGMTAAEACETAKRFLDESRHRRYRCVCIVHGRGLHSEGNVAVLQAKVRACLRSHSSVLAYVNAPRSLGGAVYVLLRR